MNKREHWLRERARTLLSVAEDTDDPTLRVVALAQCGRVQMQAVQLELARKQKTLMALGIPLMA